MRPPFRSPLVEIAFPEPRRAGARRWALVMVALGFLGALLHVVPASRASAPMLSLVLSAIGPFAVGLYRRSVIPERLRLVEVAVAPGAIVLEAADGVERRLELDAAGAVWVESRLDGHEIVVVLPRDRVARINVGDRRTAVRFANAIRRARSDRGRAERRSNDARAGSSRAAFGRIPTDVLDDGRGLGGLFALTFLPLLLAYATMIFGSTRVGVGLTFVSALSFLTLALAFGRRAIAQRLDIGCDGLAFRTGASGRATFVPFSHVADVCADDDEIALTLLGRWQTRIDVGRGSSAKALASELRRRAKHRDKRSLQLPRLGRNERTNQAWKDDLARIATEGHYRKARLGLSDLLAVVESPTVPVEQRVGAALAISASGDHEAADRVRIASTQYVEPALVRALAAACEGEIDEAAVAEAERVAAVSIEPEAAQAAGER